MNFITYFIILIATGFHSQPHANPDHISDEIPVYKYETATPLNLRVSAKSSHAAGRLFNAYIQLSEDPFSTPIGFQQTRHSFMAIDRDLYKKGIIRDKTDEYCVWLEDKQDVVKQIMSASHMPSFLPSQGNFYYNYTREDPRLRLSAPLGSSARILSHDATRHWVKGDHKGAIDRISSSLHICKLVINHPTIDTPTIYTITQILDKALSDFEWMLNSPYCTQEDRLDIARSLKSVDPIVFHELRKSFAFKAIAMVNWTETQLDQPGTSLDFWKLYQQVNKTISDIYTSNNIPQHAQSKNFDPHVSPEQLYLQAKSDDPDFRLKLANLITSHDQLTQYTRDVCQDLIDDQRNQEKIKNAMEFINSTDNLLPDIISIRPLATIVSSTDSSEELFTQLLNTCEQTPPSIQP